MALPTVPGVHVEADDEDEDEEMSGGGSDDEGEEDEEEDEDGESIQDMGIDEGEEGARQGLAMDDQQQIRTELLSYQVRCSLAQLCIPGLAEPITSSCGARGAWKGLRMMPGRRGGECVGRRECAISKGTWAGWQQWVMGWFTPCVGMAT